MLHKKISPRDIEEDFFSVMLETLRNITGQVSNCLEFFPYLAQNRPDSTSLLLEVQGALDAKFTVSQ